MNQIPDKPYFRIGEVAKLIGVEPHVLRYWETEFPMLKPSREAGTQRFYRKEDVETAQRIRELLYGDLYTIAGARKRLERD